MKWKVIGEVATGVDASGITVTEPFEGTYEGENKGEARTAARKDLAPALDVIYPEATGDELKALPANQAQIRGVFIDAVEEVK